VVAAASEVDGNSRAVTLRICEGKRLLAFLREKPFRQCRAEGKIYQILLGVFVMKKALILTSVIVCLTCSNSVFAQGRRGGCGGGGSSSGGGGGGGCSQQSSNPSQQYMTSNYSPQSYMSQQGYQNPAYMHQTYLQQIQQQMQLQSMRQQMALAELQRQKQIDEENRKERLTRLAAAIRAKDQASRSKRAESIARDKSSSQESKIVSID
jgi:hypothetical protein